MLAEVTERALALTGTRHLLLVGGVACEWGRGLADGGVAWPMGRGQSQRGVAKGDPLIMGFEWG